MDTRTAEERKLAAQIAASERWKNTSPEDRTAATAKARETFQRSFEEQVDPDGILDPKDRAARAKNARDAYYARLRLQGLQARRRKREAAKRELAA